MVAANRSIPSPLLRSRRAEDTAVAERPPVRPPPTSYAGVAALGFALMVLAAAGTRMTSRWPLEFFGVWLTLILCSLAFLWILNRRRSAAARRLLAAGQPANNDLAMRCWLRGVAERPAGACFDARLWLESRPSGPRTIALGVDLPGPIDADDLAEDADVGAGGGVSKSELVWLVLIAGWLAFRIAAEWMIDVNRGLATLTILLPVLAWIAYRLGFRPVQLGGVTAGPGVIRVTSWGRNLEFHRGDSVLVLWGVHWGAAAVCLVRRDGLWSRLTFADSAQNPRLQQLLTRWSAYEDGQNASAAPDDDQVPPLHTQAPQRATTDAIASDSV